MNMNREISYEHIIDLYLTTNSEIKSMMKLPLTDSQYKIMKKIWDANLDKMILDNNDEDYDCDYDECDDYECDDCSEYSDDTNYSF